MECYEEAVGEGSKVRMSAVAYNSVLDTLCKNGKFDEALKLFDRMLGEHNPPRRLAVNLGSFNVMVDGYCSQGRFKDAMEVFRKMGDDKCNSDALSFNNLIAQLCKNGMTAEAEELYGKMEGKGVKPDEYTYCVLMDTCFKENKIDDGASYYTKMVESKLRPNLAIYNRLVDEMGKVGKIDEAKSFYDMMVKKLKMDDASYKFRMGALSKVGKLDKVLKMVDALLDEEGLEFSEDLQECIKGELRKEGREEDLSKFIEEKERLKAEAKAKEIEAAKAAKRSARLAVASLIPSKFGKNGDSESVGKQESIEEAIVAGSASTDAHTNGEVITDENTDDTMAKNGGTTEQQVTA